MSKTGFINLYLIHCCGLGTIYMPKSSKKQIDADEKQIVNILKRNAKDSIDVIAKKCGFSRQKVWRIVKRLEKNKTIWGYSAVVDDEKLDNRHFTILFKRSMKPIDDFIYNEIQSKRVDEYYPELKIMAENVFYVSGTYDLIITLTAPGIVETKMFCEKIFQIAREYLSDYEILETITPIRKNGLRNPHLMRQIKSLL
ncbi:MAG: Lrp/AsnC family transcriptional regulator [Thermoplasmatota archaeon]